MNVDSGGEQQQQSKKKKKKKQDAYIGDDRMEMIKVWRGRREGQPLTKIELLSAMDNDNRKIMAADGGGDDDDGDRLMMKKTKRRRCEEVTRGEEMPVARCKEGRKGASGGASTD